jgi:hypothetical protein
VSHPFRGLAAWILSTALVAISGPVFADAELVAERLGYYAHHFPGIRFLHLSGGINSAADLREVRALLGPQAREASYEHPDEVSAQLLQLSLARLNMMLMQQRASASFYDTRSDSSRERYVCIITLDPQQVAGDALRATLSMVDASEDLLAGMPTAHHLDPDQHLRFVIDHEVFHCLDPYVNRAIGQSHAPHWGEYMAHLNEHGADAFALAQNLVQHGGVSDYARNLLRLRALSLLSDDLNHYTVSSMLAVLRADPESMRELSPRALAVRAGALRDSALAGYEEYVLFRHAAERVPGHLGIATEGTSMSSDTEVDARLVERLSRHASGCYLEYFGTPLVDSSEQPDRGQRCLGPLASAAQR